MGVEILQLATVVARLQSQVAAFKMIEGAAELETALKGGVRMPPACFVVAASEQAATVTQMAGAIRQRVVDRFDVIYAVKNASSRGGAEAVDGDLRVLRLATLAALVGWEPLAAFGACEHESGTLISISGGLIWWKDRIKTNHYNTQ